MLQLLHLMLFHNHFQHNSIQTAWSLKPILAILICRFYSFSVPAYCIFWGGLFCLWCVYSVLYHLVLPCYGRLITITVDHSCRLGGACQTELIMSQNNQWCLMCMGCSAMEITWVLSSYSLILDLNSHSLVHQPHFQAIIIQVCILSLGNKCTFQRGKTSIFIVAVQTLDSEGWDARVA